MAAAGRRAQRDSLPENRRYSPAKTTRRIAVTRSAWGNAAKGESRSSTITTLAAGLLTAIDPVDLDYEYQMSLVAKCVLWAAHREAATQLAGLPEQLTWPVLADGDRSLRLSLEHQGSPVAAEVSLAVRTAQDLFRLPQSPLDGPGVEQTQAAIEPVYQHNSKVSLEPGRKELSFRLPAFAGRRLLCRRAGERAGRRFGLGHGGAQRPAGLRDHTHRHRSGGRGLAPGGRRERWR